MPNDSLFPETYRIGGREFIIPEMYSLTMAWVHILGPDFTIEDVQRMGDRFRFVGKRFHPDDFFRIWNEGWKHRFDIKSRWQEPNLISELPDAADE